MKHCSFKNRLFNQILQTDYFKFNLIYADLYIGNITVKQVLPFPEFKEMFPP